jgi:hypothetical protein
MLIPGSPSPPVNSFPRHQKAQILTNINGGGLAFILRKKLAVIICLQENNVLESSFLLPGRRQTNTSQQQNLVGSWLGKQLLGLLLAVGLLLAGGRVALAESVTVSDGARVLVVVRVKSEGA